MQRAHPPEWDLWPQHHPWNIPAEKAYETAGPALEQLLAKMQVPESLWGHLTGASLGLGAWVAAHHRGSPLLIGINGAQGSGKSTTAELLTTTLREVHGLATIQCSIDDFYLTYAERVRLAETIHPLLITRGVPGTHDLVLLNQTLNGLLTQGPLETTCVPRFNKAKDDRFPDEAFNQFKGRADVVILEGWCVGTIPQPECRLQESVNRLETAEDALGIWRKYVNDALSEAYQSLFKRLDLLVLLKIPDFSAVIEWRSLQERKLAQQAGHLTDCKIMDAAAIERFIMHYERLTRWNLETLPRLADMTLEIDAHHRFVRAKQKAELLTP